MISGEFGTGKRHLANLIHYQSKFKDKLPVSIDCAKLTNEALDKLFLDNKEYLNENLFVRSNNNTLILTNVDILPQIYQKKFLFFLENENFFKNLNIKLNIKIICITESDIKKDIEKENFLKQLFERISTDHIKTIPLAQRREDILPILDYYLENNDEPDILTGADVIKAAKKHCDNCEIIMMSSQQNAHITSELMKQGIYDYIDKTVNTKNRLGAVIQKLLSKEFMVAH